MNTSAIRILAAGRRGSGRLASMGYLGWEAALQFNFKLIGKCAIASPDAEHACWFRAFDAQDEWPLPMMMFLHSA